MFDSVIFDPDVFDTGEAAPAVQGDASWWTMGSWCLLILLVLHG